MMVDGYALRSSRLSSSTKNERFKVRVQHVMGTEIFEIGFRLLARGDVGQREPAPATSRVHGWQHGELQQQMQLGAVERVVTNLALLEQFAVPRSISCSRKCGSMSSRNTADKIVQQRLFVGRAEHVRASGR